MPSRIMRGAVFILILGFRLGAWSTPRSARLTTGKDPRYASYRRLGGPRSGMEAYGKEKIFWFHQGYKPQSIQPVAGHCTGYAVLALQLCFMKHLFHHFMGLQLC
jgi:hypothetical protein